MPRTREELEQIERTILAPYAQLSVESRGRTYQEAPPEWRTQYQRDRDRVIHSRAFRRLEYKTQVFLNGTGDHFRTRLTHTMEVAGIARSISRALRLNEDLTETIALSHDLGHSPFGHKGEAVLNALMKKHGGFEHNDQSLRIVEELEQKYPGFPGLNLSWEVREGLAKHRLKEIPRKGARTGSRTPGGPSRTAFIPKCPSLEAQVANLADEVTYYSHDLDDGLDSNLLNEQELEQNVGLWSRAARLVKTEHGRLPDECRRYFIIRCIIDLQVKDVVATTEKAIHEAGVTSADEVRLHPKPLAQYSASRHEDNLELRKFLYQNLYFNPAVNEPHLRARRVLEDLFVCYLEHHEEVGQQARQRARKNGWHRAICDYLAGMTDRYAIQEHRRLFGL